MKGWLVGLALTIALAASGVGLWVTWDSTQLSTADTIAARPDRLVTPTTSTTGPVTSTSMPAAPPCTTGDDPVVGDPETDWATTVVDTLHSLAGSYAPSDLVEVTEAGFDSRDQVRAVVVDDLRELRAAAEANGTPIVVVSGYRSFSYQQGLFQRRVDEVGEAEAALRTARPGHSEHQLGTAIDVLEPGVGELTTDFAASPAGKWLAEHAHEFGFVSSYPDGARDRTCYEFEPWHLRYVGRDVAQQIHESGATAREWMLAARDSDAG